MRYAPRPQICDRARTYASLRLDGELSEFERALLASHLESCDACRAFATDVERLTSELRTAPPERLETPLALPGRVRVGLRRLQLGAAAAALVSVVGAGSLLTQLGGNERLTISPTPRAQVVEPSLRALRASDLRPAPVQPQGVKILPT